MVSIVWSSMTWMMPGVPPIGQELQDSLGTGAMDLWEHVRNPEEESGIPRNRYLWTFIIAMEKTTSATIGKSW